MTPAPIFTFLLMAGFFIVPTAATTVLRPSRLTSVTAVYPSSLTNQRESRRLVILRLIRLGLFCWWRIKGRTTSFRSGVTRRQVGLAQPVTLQKCRHQYV